MNIMGNDNCHVNRIIYSHDGHLVTSYWKDARFGTTGQ